MKGKGVETNSVPASTMGDAESTAATVADAMLMQKLYQQY